MSASLLIWAGVAGTLAFGVIVLVALAHAIEAKAEAQAQAKAEAKNARAQEEYAEIATRGSDPDSTAGVLDDGRFLVSPAQDVQPGGTAGGSRGDKGRA